MAVPGHQTMSWGRLQVHPDKCNLPHAAEVREAFLPMDTNSSPCYNYTSLILTGLQAQMFARLHYSEHCTLGQLNGKRCLLAALRKW